MKHNTAGADDRAQGDLPREEFWRDMLRRFAAGGQSVRAFCESHGLSEPSFYSWRRTLAQQDAASAPSSRGTSPPAFVSVLVAQENNPPMEVVLRGERRIRLCGPVDRAALADVVAALESVPSEGGGRC